MKNYLHNWTEIIWFDYQHQNKKNGNGRRRHQAGSWTTTAPTQYLKRKKKRHRLWIICWQWLIYYNHFLFYEKRCSHVDKLNRWFFIRFSQFACRLLHFFLTLFIWLRARRRKLFFKCLPTLLPSYFTEIKYLSMASL